MEELEDEDAGEDTAAAEAEARKVFEEMVDTQARLGEEPQQSYRRIPTHVPLPIPPTGAAGRGAAVHRGGEGDGQLRPRLGHRRHGAVGLCGAVADSDPSRAGSRTALTPCTPLYV